LNWDKKQLLYVDYYEEELGKMWPVKKAVATECYCLKIQQYDTFQPSSSPTSGSTN